MLHKFFLGLLIFFGPSSLLFALSPYPDRPRDYVLPPNVSTSNYMHMIHFPHFEYKCNTPPIEWLREKVEKDLAPFRANPISIHAVNATAARISSYDFPSREHLGICSPSKYLWRYRIIGQSIYRYGQYASEMDHILRTLAILGDHPTIPDLPSVDLLYIFIDGVPLPWDPPEYWIAKNPSEQAPLLTTWKLNGTPFVITTPQRSSMASWTNFVHHIQRLNRSSPWQAKIKRAFWRGSNSDVYIPYYEGDSRAIVDHYRHRPRYQICYLSSIRPHDVDAGFTMGDPPPTQAGYALFNFIARFKKPYASLDEHLSYAYLPMLDGYGNMGSGGGGFEWRLLSNCTVFKQESNYSTWFENGLTPYVHYIPVHNNMDNLLEQIAWAREHDEYARQIANTGTHFALNNLTTEDHYFYLLYLFREYAKCQNFTMEELLEDTLRDPNWIRIR